MRRTRNVNPQSQSEWRKTQKVQGEVKRGNGTEILSAVIACQLYVGCGDCAWFYGLITTPLRVRAGPGKVSYASWSSDGCRAIQVHLPTVP